MHDLNSYKLTGEDLSKAVCDALGIQPLAVITGAARDGAKPILWEGDPSGSIAETVSCFCRSVADFDIVEFAIYPPYHCEISLAMGLIDRVLEGTKKLNIKIYHNCSAALVQIGRFEKVTVPYSEVGGNSLVAQCTAICRAVLLWKSARELREMRFVA
jgi:hypothetical protein